MFSLNRSPCRTSICRFDAAATQPLDCTAEQTAAAQLLANGAEDGAPMRLSPCDLYPYLRGRTLWLIGWVAQGAQQQAWPHSSWRGATTGSQGEQTTERQTELPSLQQKRVRTAAACVRKSSP